jgi:hypothetical protein
MAHDRELSPSATAQTKSVGTTAFASARARSAINCRLRIRLSRPSVAR